MRTRPHAPIHYGGQLAAPVFREIATKLYAMHVEKKNATLYVAQKDSTDYFYAGFTPDLKNIFKTLNISYRDSVRRADWSNVYNNYQLADQAVIKEKNINSQSMPDLRGMGLKDALYLLENMGLKVQSRGKGKVMIQSVQAGTVLERGMTVYVELG